MPDGSMAINQTNDKTVWNMLFKMLEIRMQNGEFTVIDATNSKTVEMNRYKDLAKNHRYRIYCIDMTDIPKEEAKRRNLLRDKIKRVPEIVIDKMYARFTTEPIPSGIKVLKPEELERIWYKPMNLSDYKRIHCIGDIHGCNTALREYISGHGNLNKDEFYIFLGDYIDRGIENVEVVNYLCEISKLKNTYFIEGNHEKWLWFWSNNYTTRSKEFKLNTEPQLTKEGVDRKSIREFCRKLAQCAYFRYYENTYIVTHGGISSIPENLTKISTKQMIEGVGKYEDVLEVGQSFDKLKNDDSIYQIHGHRNIQNLPAHYTSGSFNLEGAVEFGGELRCLSLYYDDNDVNIDIVSVKNHVFKKPIGDSRSKGSNEDLALINTPIKELMDSMRDNKYVYEKKFGNISSFNFTPQAFKKRVWDDITTKARGLYINTKENKICARAYEKFFSINERPETKFDLLRYTMRFPVASYLKYNGFLGVIGWNSEEDDLLIVSKSSASGVHSGYMRNLFYKIYGDKTANKVKSYIKTNDVSFIFECVDAENDPHIIKYPESRVVLLDVINNRLNYEKLSYDELTILSNSLGLEVKEKTLDFYNWQEFFNWYESVTVEGYKYGERYIEGFVIEDSDGFMTKLKSDYYNFWKHMRSVADQTIKYGYYKYTGSLSTSLSKEFFSWCRLLYEIPIEIRGNLPKDICSLRDMFYKYKETGVVLNNV